MHEKYEELRLSSHGTGRIFVQLKIRAENWLKIRMCVCVYVNTCILGRTYFVERSIHLIEEH